MDNMGKKINLKERFWKFDYLKAFAILFVILTHSNFSDGTKKLFFFPYLIYSAVPIFIIVSGYMYSKHYSCNGEKIIDIYFLINQFRNLFGPYFLVFLLELVIFRLTDNMKDFREILIMFISGGWGPGGYYIQILLQLLFIFPIIFFLIKKAGVILGGGICVGIQLLLEFIFQFNEFPSSLYRLLLFRYIIFIYLGILLYKDSRKKSHTYLVIVGSVLSFIYIYYITYKGFVPELVFKLWTVTSLPTAGWTYGLVLIFLRKIRKLNLVLHLILSDIGKSTYFIFLFQLLYFNFKPGNLNTSPFFFIIDIFICVLGGLAFGKSYKYMTAIVLRRRKFWKRK